MNSWLVAAIALLLALLPCGWNLARARHPDALVTLQFASTLCVLMLTFIAIGFNRESFLDIALTLALLGYPASLLFAHFLERWL